MLKTAAFVPRLSFLLCIASACTAPALRTATTAGPLISAGGIRRHVIELTDLDNVRDVAPAEAGTYVATDRGVVFFPSGADPGASTRFTRREGLPSNDVTALAIGSDGSVLAATAGGLAAIRGNTVTPVPANPPVGRIVDLYIGADGTVWTCGLGGVARFKAGAWVVFGEPVQCTTLVPDGESDLWVGTMSGLWLVEGEAIREHAVSRGLPEPYVRDVVPIGSGRLFALLQGPSSAVIGYFDGDRWFGYTVADFEPAVVALARFGGDVVMFTEGHAFAITPSGNAHSGAPLVALSASGPGGVRSFGARLTPVARAQVSQEAESARLRAPSALTRIEAGHGAVEAPRFTAVQATITTAATAALEHVYRVRAAGDRIYLAGRNAGVTVVEGASHSTLSTRDLAGTSDLQVATDAAGRTWVLSWDGGLGRWSDGALARVSVADEFEPMAIASGPGGMHVIGRVGHEGAMLRVYRAERDHFSQVAERTLALPPDAPFAGIGLLGVAPDGKFWAGILVGAGSSSRARGVVVIDPRSDALVYHHRGASQASGAADALDIPDEVSSIDFDPEGNAWFASLSGAVRVGGGQAVIFGESRGVRGEVVSDLAVGERGRVWLASAEGVGYYENRVFEFRLPDVVRQAHPSALAVDMQGQVWGAGRTGLVFYDGSAWRRMTRQNGLPVDAFVDVEVDGGNRVWLLADDRLLVLAPN